VCDVFMASVNSVSRVARSVSSVNNNGLDKEEESYTEGAEDHGD